MYGVHFCQYISKVFPVNKIHVQEMMSACRFLNGIGMSEMDNSYTRCLLYRYYYVTMYVRACQYNCYYLPTCFILSIRHTYLRLDGSNYTPIMSLVTEIEKKKIKKKQKNKRT